MTMILIKAIQDSRPKQAQLLLKAGVSVDSTDDSGVTALMSVSTLNNSMARRVLVRILLSYGADCNKKDKNGQTALSWACKYGRDDVMHQILKNQNGTELDFGSDDNEGRSYLFLAASSGNCKAIRQILQPMRKSCGYEKLHRVDNQGASPLVEAFRQGHYDCVNILIKEGKASVSSILKYLQSQEDYHIRERLMQGVKNFKKTRTASNCIDSVARSNEEGLQERDVEEYLLSRDGSVECRLPQIEESQLVAKNMKRTRHSKSGPLVVRESKSWTVKLFSMYADQCSASFVKGSFPLIKRLPQATEASAQAPTSHYVQSRKSSQTSSTTRYSSFIPPLLEVSENKPPAIKRKKSVRKTSIQQRVLK